MNRDDYRSDRTDAPASVSGNVGPPRDTLPMDLSPEKPAVERSAVVLLSRLGERWSQAEYAQLAEELRLGLTVSEIAEAHGRPAGAISAACNRLLPAEEQPRSRRHAPAALTRYLAEHPDERLVIQRTASGRSRRGSDDAILLVRPSAGLLPVTEALLEPGDAAALLSEALAGLEGKPREQKILRMRVGFEGAPRTLAEIAREFDLSRERIRQIESRARNILVHQARTPGSPGSVLASLLHLPSADLVDEAFAGRIATIAMSEFEAPSRVTIPLLLSAAGVTSPIARQLAVLARATEDRFQELERERRRVEAAERRLAAVVQRADSAVARWNEHASWPVTLNPPPVRGTLRALRLGGSGEAAGSFHFDKLRREVFYESSLELTALSFLENSTDIAWYQEQPLAIPYTWRGRPHVYYPDVLAATRTGQCLIIEVKPLVNMPIALNLAKAAAARVYAHRHGWGWVTVDGALTSRDLDTYVIPTHKVRAINARLETHGHLDWGDILELRVKHQVRSRDIAAFVAQTGARLTLESYYRITGSR
ncbi:DNA-directed RNA polymerase, sigma subunit (sigma70/sigma32) [Microbacterium testaceum StLB037]|uniref:DNA-directed RNA polymerase, sigma subunit (Sigma70/sigma32) n=2 Tax=Microbacterium testaceum TaxID=2033 RepID=E8N8Z0_MICTS|nr:DNA-directed RNA polymerase, sigma subunit (sigma70/sigma32) [Microbacterium testaceum StLB037]